MGEVKKRHPRYNYDITLLTAQPTRHPACVYNTFTIFKADTMAFTPLFCLTVLLVLGVASSDTSAKKRCIKGKYEESLGQSFTDCYNTKTSLEIARIKQCYQDIMKTNNVVKTANGQMTVDRENFRSFGAQNNKPVHRAMQACYNSTSADDAMYQEAARASQCVFDRVKTTC